MPYLGNPAVDRFTSTKAASVYSGDGSTVAFTLEHSVGADEDILVSVDGVIQEPSVAYAVSSGTTLTFTAAPSSNSGNNIFVYYLFRTIGTVTHPPTSALSATSGTFTGALTGTTGTFTGVVQATDDIGNSFNQFYALGDGNVGGVRFGNTTATNGFIYYDNGSNMNFHSAGVEHMRISSIGAVTKPLQPAFNVKLSGTQANLPINAITTIKFNAEIFDNNSDFTPSTGDGQGGDGSNVKGVFTAPVTGRYQLNAMMYMDNFDIGTQYYQMEIKTSNRVYYDVLGTSGFDADMIYHGMSGSVLADMDAGDTASIQIQIPNSGAAQTDIEGISTFSGYLVC